MSYTIEQYTLAIRCCLVQRRQKHIVIQHSSFGDPDDIPAFRNGGTLYRITDILLPGGSDKTSVIVLGWGENGREDSFRLPAAPPEAWGEKEALDLFETVYHWDNSINDPEPEEWLDNLFKPGNALLRQFLRDETILPGGALVQGLFRKEGYVRLTLIPGDEHRRLPLPGEELLPEDYTYALVPTDGKPVVYESSNYGWGACPRGSTRGTLEEVAAALPDNNPLATLLAWLAAKDIHPYTVRIRTLHWQNPSDFE